jgi:hypothetical protein
MSRKVWDCMTFCNFARIKKQNEVRILFSIGQEEGAGPAWVSE